MFRPIRRKTKVIDMEVTRRLLREERRGVLAVNGDNGYPYAVPVNYYYDEEANRIYFHGAKAGHKMDSLKKDNKICFTVYGDETAGDPSWAPYLKSAVVFGRCHLVSDTEEAMDLCRRFAQKYYPDEASIEKEIAVSGKAVQMFAIEIEHISGKQIQEI